MSESSDLRHESPRDPSAVRHDVPPAFSPDRATGRGVELPADDGAANGTAAATGASENALAKAGHLVGHLRDQLAELDRREQNVSTQIAELDRARRQFTLVQAQTQDETEAREAKLRGREREADQRQSELSRVADELETEQTELADARQQLARDRANMKDELARELDEQRDTLARQQRELLDSIETEKRRQDEHERTRQIQAAAFAAEQKAATAEHARRLAEEKSAHETALEKARVDFETLRSERTTALDEREETIAAQAADFEKQSAFHAQALRQLRDEVDQARRELDRVRSKHRNWIEAAERVQQQRLVQMRRFRDLLEQREESLTRERRLLEEDRRAAERKIDAAQQTWAEQEAAARASLADAEADLERRRTRLTRHAENLEERRTRLDALREELEQTHQATLEQRVAIEQVQARLIAEDGEQPVESAIEEARASLAEHHERMRAALAQSRDEMTEARTALQQQRDEFRTERQRAIEAAASQQDTIAQRETSMRAKLDEIEARQQRWDAARDRWRQEKIDAEAIIRNLLRQLDRSETPATKQTLPRAA